MNRLNIVLIIFSLAMIFAKIAADPVLTGPQQIQNDIQIVIYLIMFVMLLLGIFYVLTLAAKASKMTKYLLLVCTFLVATLFIVFVTFQPDDEMLISYFAYHAMLNGTDPYNVSYANQLVPALTALGTSPTYQTNGSIVSVYSYPIGYIFAQAPFFYFFNPIAQNLGRLVMPTEYIVYFGIFILSAYYVIKERQKDLPNYSSIVLAGLVFLAFSSTIILLLLTLMVLLYTSWGKRYAWLILGILASLQQQTWIFILLYIASEMRTRGIEKTFFFAFDILFVFLVINGYFIFLSPHSFINAFLGVGNLKPDFIAPIGTALIYAGLSSTNVLGLVYVSVIVLFVWIAAFRIEKKWIPLLSAIPFLFIGHALPIYFILPFAVFAIIQTDDIAITNPLPIMNAIPASSERADNLPIEEKDLKILLLDLEKHPGLKAMLHLVLSSGMSLGDCLELKIQDIDYNSNIMKLFDKALGRTRIIKINSYSMKVIGTYQSNRRFAEPKLFPISESTAVNLLYDISQNRLNRPISWTAIRRTWAVLSFKHGLPLKDMIESSGASPNQLATWSLWSRQSNNNKEPPNLLDGLVHP